MSDIQAARPRRRFYGGPNFGNPLGTLDGRPRPVLHRCGGCGVEDRIEHPEEPGDCERCGGEGTVHAVVHVSVWLPVSMN